MGGRIVVKYEFWKEKVVAEPKKKKKPSKITKTKIKSCNNGIFHLRYLFPKQKSTHFFFLNFFLNHFFSFASSFTLKFRNKHQNFFIKKKQRDKLPKTVNYPIPTSHF